MSINLFYQNVRSIRGKVNDFYNNSFIINADILCITETWLNSHIYDTELLDSRYTIYRKDRMYELSNTTRGGGCIIAIKSNIISEYISSFEYNSSHIENLWVKVKTSNSNIYFCLGYISPACNTLDYINFLHNLNDNITKLESNSLFFLLGDFNLPSIEWKLTDNIIKPTLNSNHEPAEELLSLVNFNSLAQLNSFKNFYGSTLDLIFTNTSLDNLELQLSKMSIVKEDLYHPSLSLDIKFAQEILTDNTSHRLNFYKANYPMITSKLNLIDWTILDAMDTNSAITKFYEIINNIIHKNVPLRTKKTNYPIWFNSNLISTFKKKNKIRDKLKRDPLNSETITEFNNIRKLAKKLIYKTQKDFISNIEKNLHKNIKIFWAYTKSKRQTNTYPAELNYNNVTSSDSTVICEMFSSFFQSTYNVNNTTPNSYQNNINSINSTLNSLSFTAEETEKVINNLNTHKGAGPDGIPNIFFQKTSSIISLPLTVIFNKSLANGICPIAFKEAFVVPIFKQGKKSLVTNYRPISILNAITKILEKLVHTKLSTYFATIISPFQHGFMKNRSTLTNLSIYTNTIATALDSGKEVHSIYTDFSKAFDTVNIDLLLMKLSKYGISNSICNWLTSYLKNRQLKIVFNGSHSKHFTPNAGVPQGSILGPLLFNIFINDIGQNLKNSHLFYADDLKIYKIINDQNDTNDLNQDLCTLHEWCTTNKLSLNISKCKAINFSNKRNPTPPDYRINSIPLETVSSIKDLGIQFDSKFKFDLHIQTITAKALKMLGFVSRLTKNFKSKNPQIILYNALVKSNLEYLTPIWTPHQNCYATKLEKIQKKFTRILYYNTRTPHVPYINRLETLKMNQLSDRRNFYDLCLLYKIIHHTSLTSLYSQLEFNNSERTNLSRNLFRQPLSRTNIGKFLCPTNRVQELFIKKFGNIDIFNENYNQFKKIVKESLN